MQAPPLIADLLKSPVLGEIPCVAGEVRKVWDVKSGDGKYGHWTMQGVIIADDSGEIRITLKDRDEWDDRMQGKWVRFDAVPGKKGTTGVKLEPGYKEKEKREVMVSKVAEISFDPDRDADTPRQPRQNAPQSRGNADSRPSAGDPVSSARKQAMKAANGMLLAIDAAVYVTTQVNEKHGVPLTQEHFQACCASIFIYLDRHHVVDTLPAHPLEKKGKSASKGEPQTITHQGRIDAIQANLSAEGVPDDVFFAVAAKKGWIEGKQTTWSAISPHQAAWLFEHAAEVQAACLEAAPDVPF